MQAIKPHKNNCRYCEKCHAGYVINGDESGYWCKIPGILRGDTFYLGAPILGLCHFCKKDANYNNSTR